MISKASETIKDKKICEKFNSILEDDLIRSTPTNDVSITLALLAKVLSQDLTCFKTTISGIVMRGGDGVCGHAAIIGGIVGALTGYSKLPQEWLMQLPDENKKWLNNKLNNLLDLFGLP